MRTNLKLDHAAVRDLLPWYVTNTLDVSEHAEVERHLTSCGQCRIALEQYRRLSAAAQETPEELWTPSRAHLDRLMQQIETLEGASDRRRWSFRFQWPQWLTSLSGPARWALVTQTAMISVLAVLLANEPQLSRAPDFETKTDPKVLIREPQLRLVFTEDMTEKELRELLHAIDGEITAGPSRMGVYTVRSESVTAAVETARRHPKVKLAEPVTDDHPLE
jgi:hypothetical protein